MHVQRLCRESIKKFHETHYVIQLRLKRSIISPMSGVQFHKELSTSHHTQFLDKGDFVSQLLISEAVTFYCNFQAGEKIMISGITEHFYVVAGYRSWSIRCCCKQIFVNVIFTAQGIVIIFSKPLRQHMSTNTGHMRQYIWMSPWIYIPYMSSTFTQGYQHRFNIFKIT